MTLPAAVHTPSVLITSAALELPPPGATVKLDWYAAVAGTPVRVSAAWGAFSRVTVTFALVAARWLASVPLLAFPPRVRAPLFAVSCFPAGLHEPLTRLKL